MGGLLAIHGLALVDPYAWWLTQGTCRRTRWRLRRDSYLLPRGQRGILWFVPALLGKQSEVAADKFNLLGCVS